MLVPALVIALLVSVNALYVAAEFASVAVRRGVIQRLAREGNARAAGLLAVLEDGVRLDRYIAACQIGITLSSLVVGAYGQATLGVQLASRLERWLGLEALAAESTAALVVLVALTVLQVVLGELVPKSLALQFPLRTALLTYLPTRWSAALYRPLIAVLNGSGLVLLKPLGVTPGGHQHVHSPEEIELLFAESQRAGELELEAHGRLRRALRISARTTHQLMVPRGKIVAIDLATPEDELLRAILESPYSRLPVHRGSLDEVIGTIDVKRVAARYATRGELGSIEELVRPIPFVPERLTADRLVRFLQERKSSKAIVVDEFGGVAGIVSMEDVLAEVFGDLTDELKEAVVAGAERLDDGRVRLPGPMPLDDAEAWLGVRWEGSEATVGGHVVGALGRLPEEGEVVEVDGVEVTVLEMRPTAIAWIAARPRERADEGEEGA